MDPVITATDPGTPCWDYAIGWKSRSGPEGINFAEAHPANNGHVNTIVQKKQSVVEWIHRHAPLVATLVVESRKGDMGRLLLELFVHEAGLQVAPFDAAQADFARMAWRLYARVDNRPI